MNSLLLPILGDTLVLGGEGGGGAPPVDDTLTDASPEALTDASGEPLTQES